jgi:hypothetical protein
VLAPAVDVDEHPALAEVERSRNAAPPEAVAYSGRDSFVVGSYASGIEPLSS